MPSPPFVAGVISVNGERALPLLHSASDVLDSLEHMLVLVVSSQLEAGIRVGDSVVYARPDGLVVERRGDGAEVVYAFGSVLLVHVLAGMLVEVGEKGEIKVSNITEEKVRDALRVAGELFRISVEALPLAL